MCQDEDENQNFGSFWNLCMTNEPLIRYEVLITITNQFVFVFVFVLAHEQAISKTFVTQS